MAGLLQHALEANKRLGLNQRLLAERSGVPLATLNAWVTGRRTPSNTATAKKQLRALAEHLPDVTVADLFEAIGQQVPGPLSPDAERRLMDMYRNLSAGRKKVVEQVVETLYAEERTS